MGGIGKIFRKKEDDFKNFKKLIPDDKLVSEYKKLLKLHKGIKVGISWAKYSKNDPLMKKSFDILKLSKILDYKKFKLVNLQYGDIEKDILRLKDNQNRNILTIDDINYTNDIDKVAALMCACDLVISIESFAAILSASLGLKTYVLSHIIQNFVWIKDNKNNSLWFPEAKVLKQNKTNEWIYVEKLLSNELANNF